ncbi:MAG TPA: hypothetical protein DD653_12580 [Marinilabiliales bacterium]|nr:hypothetical protein [Marinilabiliales bacterium]
MKSLSVIVLLVAFSLVSCHSVKHEALKQMDQLSQQLDSINNVYTKIDWNQWEEFNKKINDDITDIAALVEEAAKIDPDYLQYYGPYNTAGKILSRIFRKGKKQLTEELEFSIKQLENLRKDIKSGIIADTDSIQIYMSQESKAIEELVFNISTLESTLQQQKEAHDATQEKVKLLIEELKKVRPSAFDKSAEIKYNEDEEHE